MRLTAYDFETTGVDPKTCEPVQLGTVVVTIHECGSYTVESEYETLLKPVNAIPEGAAAVHGITTEDAQSFGLDPFEQVKQHVTGAVLGYNINAYDNRISQRYGGYITQSVDLFIGVSRMKKAKVLPKASLGAAFQILTGKAPENAHNALADVYMTLELIPHVMKFAKVATFSELVQWLDTPMVDINTPWPFGKHKGTPIRDLPKTYVAWALENMSNLDTDLKGALLSL